MSPLWITVRADLKQEAWLFNLRLTLSLYHDASSSDTHFTNIGRVCSTLYGVVNGQIPIMMFIQCCPHGSYHISLSSFKQAILSWSQKTKMTHHAIWTIRAVDIFMAYSSAALLKTLLALFLCREWQKIQTKEGWRSRARGLSGSPLWPSVIFWSWKPISLKPPSSWGTLK